MNWIQLPCLAIKSASITGMSLSLNLLKSQMNCIEIKRSTSFCSTNPNCSTLIMELIKNESVMELHFGHGTLSRRYSTSYRH